ncbi:bifunctional serine/threonine-protein kinase/ABC transporter substrate-binding protein [Streptomyces sp. SM14]|uniref:bifunctional serine/threonine-protein kinase/ABC transporter substrate-binding protein n=1 Tax=Streptomyces sp. SM14 TaxID=1736045 RepID=UPI000CD5345F|nr:bifunctional serine/threonine-protein kinase/ABC transporter substrate-binding protein [Streptomyces sp. SM14]
MQPLHPSDPAWVSGYRMLGRLGAGGMGMVLLGRSPGGTLVAIKLIRAEYADDVGFRARFRREVAIAQRVRNRWAVPVVDADTEAPAPWLATEFVPGPPLSEAVANHGPFPEHGVRALGTMLAEALDAVHEAGLVHRDVKPGNVLLGLDGPRLIDFGIARAMDDTVLTATDVVIGSPGFLSPEQAQGRPISPASDMFSLGCVLAYTASGQRPFGSGPVEAMLFRTVYDPPDTSGVPDALRPVVDGLLEKDPEARLDAEQLRAAWTLEESPEGWLPPPVTRLIAERSAEMLALPAADRTEIVGGSGAGTGAGAGFGAGVSGGFGPPIGTLNDALTQGPGTTPGTRPGPPEGPPTGPRRRNVLIGALATLGVIGGGVTAAVLLNNEADPGSGDGDQAGPGGEGRGRPATDRPLLVLGVQGDLEGDLADMAQAQVRGAQLAVDQLNSDTAHPFRYQLETVDDGGNADGAATAAATLTEDARVVGVLSASTSEALRASLDTYYQARLPLLTVNDGAQIIKDSVFVSARTGNALQMTDVMTYVTADEDALAVGLVQTATDYSREVTTAFGTLLRRGGRTVHPVTIPTGTADHRAPVRQLVSQQPDFIVFGGDWEDLIPFAQALDETGYDGRRIATHDAFDPRFLERAGSAAEGWMFVAAVVDPEQLDSAADFVTAFTDAFDEDPPLYAAEAYDAVQVLAACARDLHEEKELDRVTRQDIVPSIRQTRHKGVTKSFSFEPANGNFTGKGAFFYRVEDGEYLLLGTGVPED